jgi:glycerol-3-phosphate dehydrogenase
VTVTVAVLGAGRMGSVVAAQLPRATRKLIIDRDVEKARRLVGRTGGEASASLEDTADATMIFLVLPAPAINDALARLVKIVRAGCMILNMATTAHLDQALIEENRQVLIVDARIIGHAMSISKGEPGIVVVACDDQQKIGLIRNQLPGFHKVVQGDAALVEKINTIGSTEGLRAALTVKAKLAAMNIPDEWIDVAIRTVCAGTMRSYVENDLGHFARQLVQRLDKEIRS